MAGLLSRVLQTAENLLVVAIGSLGALTVLGLNSNQIGDQGMIALSTAIGNGAMVLKQGSANRREYPSGYLLGFK